MAKEMGIENFGTMRKHEVIFHILQKNAERSGIMFSEGVLEILDEGFGFLRSQSFNYLPCPEDIYVSPSQIRRFDLQTGNLVAGQIRRPRKERFLPCSVVAVGKEDPTRPKTKPTSTTSRRSFLTSVILRPLRQLTACWIWSAHKGTRIDRAPRIAARPF
jgi:transcription termination factor Rho